MERATFIDKRKWFRTYALLAQIPQHMPSPIFQYWW